MIKSVLVIACLVALYLFYSKSNTNDAVCDKIEECQYVYDSLQNKVQDLEKKVEILNRYLIMKNLEYIEACNLKY